ncbi:MAG: ion transporter, partial [Ruminiclostridium sp.]|nr:ion transporter [Ruminiclostridium sp.]
ITSILETISVVIFTIEYVLRVWIAENRIKYIFSLAAIIDLLAILPFFLPFVSANLVILRVFRIFRILRLFKLDRYVSALHTIFNVFRCKAHQLISSMIVVVLLMIVASVLIYNVEHDYQPEVFENALSGLWWAFATLTTVGYGDIYPVTVFGKVLSAIIALLGIGFVAVPTGIITSGFSEEISRNNKVSAESKQDENTVEIIKKIESLDAFNKAEVLVFIKNLSKEKN